MLKSGNTQRRRDDPGLAVQFLFQHQRVPKRTQVETTAFVIKLVIQLVSLVPLPVVCNYG